MKVKKFILFVLLALISFDFGHSLHYYGKVSEYKKNNKPMISLVDDDGSIFFYSQLYPLAKKHDIPMTSAVIAGWDHDGKRYFTEDQGQIMMADGIEIVNHGYSHDSDHMPHEMTETELREEYELSQAYCQEHGYKAHIHVYPFGSSKGHVRTLAPEYFDMAFSLEDGEVTKPLDPYNINRTNCQSVSMKKYRPLEEIHALLDQGKEDCNWIILVSHINQGVLYSEEYYEDIILYAKDLGYEFVSLEDGYNQYKVLEEDWYWNLKEPIYAGFRKLRNKIIEWTN